MRALILPVKRAVTLMLNAWQPENGYRHTGDVRRLYRSPKLL